MQHKLMAIVVAVTVLLSGVTGEAWAAKKKKDDAAEQAAKAAAEMQKTLDPINKQLDALTAKMQARSLFSPQDAGSLGKIKYQLMDLIYEHPKEPRMAKPVYQAAILYTEREEYSDAYELFSYVSDRFPKSPYGQKAALKIGELERKLGPSYFPKALTEKANEPGSKTAEKPEEAKK